MSKSLSDPLPPPLIPMTSSNVSYVCPVRDNITSPGRRIPNKTELIAWVPLTNCILTAAFSARNNLAKTASIFSLDISS